MVSGECRLNQTFPSSGIRRSTLFACMLGATLGAFGSANAAADPGRWRVEFLGDKAFQAAPHASSGTWEFRATHVGTGTTKVFKSGTEIGWYLGVHAYGRYACYVPITGSTLSGEYFEEKSVRPTGLSFRPIGIGVVVVTTANDFGVTSEHRIPLFGSCRDQSRAFAGSVSGHNADR